MADAADVTHRAIKQSELELVPEVGHLFLAESPKFLYERVLKLSVSIEDRQKSALSAG